MNLQHALDARAPFRGYPAELDAATHATRARRSLAELLAQSAPADPDRPFPGSDWVRRFRSAPFDVQEPLARSRAEAALAALDGVAADLADLPAGARAPALSVDLRLVDPALAGHLSAFRAVQASGDTAAAQSALADAVGRLADLAAPGQGTGPEAIALLAARTGLPPSRAQHLAGVARRPLRGEGVPSGTLAYAYGTLEALAYRLAVRGELGPLPQVRDHVGAALAGDGHA